MQAAAFKKATNAELRTIIFDDPMADKFDKAFARSELDRRKGQKRISGRVDKHAGSRR